MAKKPVIPDSAWIAEGATVRGDVTLGEDVGVWFGVVMRGDVAPISVGDRSNVQDGSVLHVAEGKPCVVGRDVTIGHQATVHACTVEDGALIGIGSIVLDGARIGKGAVVAAGALVPPGMEVPDGMLAIGVPAKVRGPVSEELKAGQKTRVERYVELKEKYRRGEY